MRKLKLNAEELRVESFAVSSEGAPGGTVRGQLYNDPQPTELTCIDCMGGQTWTCIGPTYCCPATWQQTCNASCFFTECGWYCKTVMAPTCQTCHTCPDQGTCGAYNTCWLDTGCGG